MAETQKLRLYVNLMSQPSRAVLTLCEELHIRHKVEVVRMERMEHKSPEYLALNPLGQVPFMDDGGFQLAESHAIMRYLVEKHYNHISHHSMWPQGRKAAALHRRAEINRWLDWHHTNLRLASAMLLQHAFLRPKLMKLPVDPVAVAKHAKRLHAVLAYLESHFQGGESQRERPLYLVGKRPSIADIALAEEVISAELVDFDLAQYRLVGAWLRRVKTLKGWGPVHVVFEKVKAKAIRDRKQEPARPVSKL